MAVVGSNLSLGVTSDALFSSIQTALLLLGVRGQPLQEDRAVAWNLQDAYQSYVEHRDSQSVQTLQEALTAAIGELERERATALKRIRVGKQDQQHESSFLSNLKAGIASWLGWSDAREDRYTKIADKAAQHLQTLLAFRAELELEAKTRASGSLAHRRRLLQTTFPSAPITQQQYYCDPLGSCDLRQISNGVSGFVIIDANYSSASFSTVGDINGDGLADFAIGSTNQAFIIFGSNNNNAWGNGTVRISALMDGQRGFVLGDSSQGIFIVNTAGDMNGDGVDDLVLGNTNASKVYVIFGNRSSNAWGNGILHMPFLAANGRGFGLFSDDLNVLAISTAGDVNGDGFDDLLVGAPNESPGFRTSAGNVYVVFGANRSNWGTSSYLTIIPPGVIGVQGVASQDKLGSAVAAVGDFNGDGLSDIILSTSKFNTSVIFGTKNNTAWANGPLNASLLDGKRGFTFTDSAAFFGCSGSAAGDMNGDGVSDIMLTCGKIIYVVFGSTFANAWGSGSVSVKSLMNGQQGFYFALGTDVVSSTVGDVNGDGLADIMVGEPQGKPLDRNIAGQTIVIFGSKLPGAWGTGNLDLLALTNVKQKFALYGQAEDKSGLAVSLAGDIDGDGLGDLMVGAAPASKGIIYVMLSNKHKPHFTANSIRVAAEQKVLLSLQDVNMSAITNQTRFLVDTVQQGYFSYVASPSAILSNFSVQDLIENRVRFVHTGNAVAPAYRLCFVDSVLSRKMCSDAEVTFLGYLPSLVNNKLVVHQGLSSVIQASDMHALDQDNLPNELYFEIYNISHGEFVVSNGTTNITINSTSTVNSFTQQAVLKGQVRFNHDNTRNKPAYVVVVNDMITATEEQAAAITFNFAPELETDALLVFDQGRATTLSPLDINASDVETFQGAIVFETANVSAGYFAYSSNLDFPITAFQQLSLITGGVQFVQDGSDETPSFEIHATDGVLSSPWQTPQIRLNYKPLRDGDVTENNTHIQVVQGEDFRFTLDTVRFRDPDENDSLTYRARLKGVGVGGGSPLPPEIRFSPPNQFLGNLPSVGSFNIEVEASDARGLAVSSDFILSSVVPSSPGGINIQQLYTSLSSICGVALTVLAYLWLRRRIAKHRRDFPFVNDLRKVLNLEYYDFTRFDGDTYKTKVNDFLLNLQWHHPDFYDRLTPTQQQCFAVCVGEILTQRGLVSRSGNGGGLFGVCCLLNVGWPNQLNLREFELQGKSIANEAVGNWKEALAAEKEYQQPLSRWPYLSPSSKEKCKVFCCCGKPSSANRWRVHSQSRDPPPPRGEGVALEELKTREGTDDDA